MINHRHEDLTTRHAVDKRCKACDLEVAAYNMEQAIDRVRDYCNAVMMDGMGVPIDDPRFTARMTAHMILNKLEGEQQ